MRSDRCRVSMCLAIVLIFPFMARAEGQAPSGSATGEPVSVELNGLRLAIDRNNGTLLRVEYPEVGVMLDSPAASAGLLDVAYPIQEFVALRLASRFSKASVVVEKDAVTISWEQLGPSRSTFKLPQGKVAARVWIKAAPDHRSVILQCRIENHSDAAVPQILFPDLHGLKPFCGVEDTQLRFSTGGPIHPFQESPVPPDSAQFYVNSNWKEYPPAGGYYGVNGLRWLDFGGHRGGFSVFAKHWEEFERPTVRTSRSQADASILRLLWEYKTGVKAGQTWDSGEIWLTPHRGGWAKGIEVFREYVRQNHPPRPLPKHVREDVGFQTMWLMPAAEVEPAYAAFKFRDIPRVAADAKKHGIRELVLWGWCDYFTLPVPARKQLGTREELLQAVREARELDVNVVPFVSFDIVVNKFAQRYGCPPGQPSWVYHPDLIPMLDPYYLGAGAPVRFWDTFEVNPTNKNWQSDAVAALKEWIDAGICSFSYDVYRADRDDPKAPGVTNTCQAVRRLARAKDPESTFSGEPVTNLESDHHVLDFTWNWVDYVDAEPATTVLTSPRLNCNVEDSPRVVKMGFADNLFLNIMPRRPDQPNATATISEKPALSEALRQVTALRKQFLPYFVEGTLIGDSVLSEASPAFVRGYVRDGKLLVIVLNNQAQPMTVTLKSALDPWLPNAARFNVQRYDGAGKEAGAVSESGANWTATLTALAALELALFEIQAKEQMPAVGRFEAHEYRIEVGGVLLRVLGPKHPHALGQDAATRERFDREGYWPFWSQPWPAAVMLAEHVLSRIKPGLEPVLELGAGLGITSLALARVGFRVVVTDYDEEALAFVRASAELNGVELHGLRRLDWRFPPAERYETILASDCLYDKQHFASLVQLLSTCLTANGCTFLSDMNRAAAEGFQPLLPAAGLRAEVFKTRAKAIPAFDSIDGRIMDGRVFCVYRDCR